MNQATTHPHSDKTPAAGWLMTLLDLTKARITVAVTLTTATGYILGAGRLAADMWIPLLGVFLLASGSSALNQCQEVRIDARMRRTWRRPLPTGRINLSTALFLAILLVLLGMYLLASTGANELPLLILGGFAVFWYNGVYTYLKRITAFAVVPGALIGAIPPLIGFIAAGGNLAHPLITLVAAFFFIWQIPHFWLLLLMHGEQYAEAGLPTLTRVFSTPQLGRVTFMWLLATAVAGLALLTVAPGAVALPWSFIMVAASVWLVFTSISILRLRADVEQRRIFKSAFIRVNVFALAIMICLALNALGIAAG